MVFGGEETQSMGVVKGHIPDHPCDQLDKKGGWRMVILDRKLWCKEENGPYLLVGQ